MSATTTTGLGGRRRARRAPTFAASTRPSTSATEEGRSDRELARARGPRLSDPLSATAVGARMTARARPWRVTSWQGVFADGHGLGRASTQVVHVGVHHLVEVVDDHDRGGGRSGRGARTRTRPPPLRPPPLRDWGRRPPDRPHPPTAGHWLPRSSSSTTMGTGGRRRRWYPSMFTTLSRSSTTTTESGRSGRELAHARGPRRSAPPPRLTRPRGRSAPVRPPTLGRRPTLPTASAPPALVVGLPADGDGALTLSLDVLLPLRRTSTRDDLGGPKARLPRDVGRANVRTAPVRPEHVG